jgi:hypothetical protein
MPYQFVKWLWAVMNHWEVFVTGGIITAILEAWNRLGPAQYEFPRKWYVVLVLLYIFFAAFLAWRDEYVRAQHVSDQVAELAAMQDDFYSRMNDWWTICEDKEKSQAAEVAAEAVRKKSTTSSRASISSRRTTSTRSERTSGCRRRSR